MMVPMMMATSDGGTKSAAFLDNLGMPSMITMVSATSISVSQVLPSSIGSQSSSSEVQSEKLWDEEFVGK